MQDLPPQLKLRTITNGFMHTASVYTAAKLRLADALVDGPLSAADLAARVQARVRSVLASGGRPLARSLPHLALTLLPLCPATPGVQEDSLRRLMRLLILLGVFKEEAPGALRGGACGEAASAPGPVQARGGRAWADEGTA